MRLFLAINFTPKVQAEFESQLARLKSLYRQFSWVPPVNYHITLHFLGEVHDVKKVKKDIETMVFDLPPFLFFANHADLFIRNDILLYIGFRREKILETLVDRIQDHYTVEHTKGFVPLLTIARYKIPSKQQYLLLRKRLQNLPIDVEYLVNKITLFESVQGGRHVEYKKLADFKLVK